MATTDFVVKNGLVVTENAVINETTDASDKDTGALVVEGGVGIEKKLYVGTDLAVGGATTLTGDLAVNGGDLTTSATTATVFNTTATTVNFAGAATTVSIGAATGTTTINNANTAITGDLAVNGGDLTTSQTTFNLVNTTATTVNFASAGTNVQIGAATGTTNINNDLDVDGDVNIDGGDLTVSTTTFNLANATATTVNFAGAATTLEIGAASGTTNINNNLVVDLDLEVKGGDLTTNQTTFNLVNATATTVNFAGAATTLDIGAATGTTTVRNSLAINGNTTIGDASGDTITVNSSTASVPNTLTFAVDDAVTNNISYPIKATHTTSGTPANGIGTGIQFVTETTAANNEIGMALEAVVTDVTATSEDFDFVVKLMTAGATAAEKFRVSSVGDATLTGDLAVNGGDLTTSAATATIFNTTATTINFGGAATDIQIGAATGTTEVNNNLNVVGDVDIDGGDLTASTASFNLVNTTATTVNFAGAATTLEIGAATGTTNINNNLVVDLDLEVKGGDLTTNQTTFNLINATATTVNFAGAATDVQIGAATGTTEINNNLNVVGDVDIDGGDLTVSTSTFNLANTTATTVNFAGAATSIEIGAATGTTNINNSLDVDGDVNIDGGDLTVSTGTFNLANTTATTVNFAGAGTTISIGAATGTTTINNANTVVTGDLAVNGADITTSSTGTATLFNANATTLNIGQAATTVSIGATTGTTTVRNSLAVNGDTTLGDATGDTITFNSSTATVPNTLTLTVDDAVTNNISYPVKISHTTTGTPANGIGTGIQFITETTATNNEIGMSLEAAVTDVTATSEDFDFVVKLMAAGAAAAERFRVSSVGNITVVGDLAVNGGDITSSATTFNLLNSTVTTLNVGGAATVVEIGAATGTTSVNNALTVDGVFTANGNTVLGDVATDTVTVTATVLPGVVISGTTTGDALRITQLGTGNALVVEDSTNPDSTPFIINASGQVSTGFTSNPATMFASVPQLGVHTTGNDGIGNYRAGNDANGAAFIFQKTRGADPGVNTIVQSDDNLGVMYWTGADGTGYIRGAQISAQVDGTPGTNDMPGRLVFSTTRDGASSPSEAFRINSLQNTLFGRTYSGSERIGIGGGTSNTTTGTSANGIINDSVVSSAQTASYTANSTFISTQAAAFTLTNLTHYKAAQFTIGAGSTVTNQYGYFVDSNLTGATNNYGFYSNIASGTGRFNFYAAGTASNYFAGNVGIGATPSGKLHTVLGTTYSPGGAWSDNNAVFGGSTSTSGAFGIAYDDTNGSYLVSITPGVAWKPISIYSSEFTVRTNGTNERLRISSAGTISLGAAPGAESLRVTPVASAVNYVTIQGQTAGGLPAIFSAGSDTNIGMFYSTKGTGQHDFYTNVASAALQFRITHTASAVNFLQVTGAPTSGVPLLQTVGSDTNVPLTIVTKGTGYINLQTGGGTQFVVANTASAVNYLQVTGAATTATPVLSATGSDTNISLRLAPKGTGTVQELYNGTYYDLVSQFDIGTNANQIPLNQYLGTMAYQNAEAVTIGTLAVTGATSLGTGFANYLSVGGASSTNPVTITTLGSDTNVGLTITSKGTGAIIVGNGSAGVDVKGGSTGFRVWDDNSSHYYQFVTGDRSANYNINLPAGDVTLVAGTMITSAGGTFTGQLISTLANNTATGGGQLYLNGATGNRIDFNTNGVAAPAFTTRSAGTKIVLFPNIGAAAVDYAIGIESGNIWSSVATTANGFKWYGGTTVAATLTGAGELTLTSNLTVSGGTITTGNVAATVLGGNTTTNIALGGGLTSGTFTLGGTATTGTITLDQSNSAHTLNIATGTNASGVTKTVNIGTNGASGSTTNVTIGAVAGSGTTVMYGNVGVGTTSPSTWGKFAVVGAASGSQVVSAIVNTSGTVNTQAVLSFDTTNNGFNVRDSQIRATNNGANQTTLEFYTANAATPTKKMQIGADGVISLGGAPGAESLRVTPVASAVNYVEIFGAVAGVGGVAIKSGGSDTNITTYYSAKGNGGHIFQSNSTVDQFRIAHTASAVDFLQVTGSASGFPSLSATGATANASIVYQAKGAGGHSFNTNNALQFQISHTASAVNYLQVTGGPTVFGPEISAQGTGTDLDLYLKTKGTGSYVFYTNSAVRQFQIAHTASAVNYLQVTGATTGNRTSFSAAGSDTNVGINYNTKGAEFHVFTTSSGAAQFVIAPTASAVNQVYATGGTTGNGPTFSAQGPDTNISISLTPKGTGGVGIGINSVGYKLDVAGKGRFLQDSAATTGAIILRSNSGNTVGGHIQWVNNDNSAQLGYIAVDPSTNMTFATGGNVQMSLLATGYNGFGLAAPTAKIHGFYSATIAPSLTWNSVSAFNLRCEASELTAGLDNASPFNYYLQARNSGSAAKTLSINPLGGNVVIGARTDPGFKLYVNGSFAATTKSFVIDHPTKPNMKLRYGSLEGPENGVYVRGRLTDSNTIELPDYWTGLVDEDSITVNLTAIGAAQDLYVVDITDNTVIIGGENVNCFYTVFAERKDVDKLVAEFE